LATLLDADTEKPSDQVPMSKTQIPELAAHFFQEYDAAAMDHLWKEQSAEFRRFWKDRVLATDSAPISDSDCDAVIRILDRNGKGNTRDSEAIARVMVPQGAWRRMFNELHTNRELGRLVDAVLEATDSDSRGVAIDRLYAANQGRPNRLTGQSGNTIGAFLAAYDPLHILSIISVKERGALMDFLEVRLPNAGNELSVGQKIVLSDSLLQGALQRAGINGSARTLSRFCYWDQVRPLWQREHTVSRPDKKVRVIVPEPDEVEERENATEAEAEELRESMQVQALLAEIGSQMGFNIWLPRSDRQRVLQKWKAKEGELLDELPLSYDPTTMRTVEEIDVLWLKRRSIVRAFEVEGTTSIYSGILRMADLLALQPNINIALHIVAPISRREKVFREIQRPVFSLLEGRPLAESCTFISYDKVRELRDEKHLAHLSEDVLRMYEEPASDED
jgi:hypothetical protein